MGIGDERTGSADVLDGTDYPKTWFIWCRGGEKSGIDQPENRARTFPLCALFAFATPAASAQSPAMLSRCARLGAPVAEALSAAPSRAPVLTVLQRARAPTAGLARPGAAICMVKLAMFSSYPRACGV